MNLDALWSALWGMLGGLLSGGALVYWQRHLRRSGRIVPRVREYRVDFHRWKGSQLTDRNGNPAPRDVNTIQEADVVTLTVEVELWNGKDVGVEIRDVKGLLRRGRSVIDVDPDAFRTASEHIAIPAVGSTEFKVHVSVGGQEVRLLELADNLAIMGYTMQGKRIVLQLCELQWP